jgi:DNA-binding response OmpR family regulator/c-di-GMP-binding flagellar brake protein YcgR
VDDREIRRALLVDDETRAAGLCGLLGRRGFETVCCTEAGPARAALEDGRFDLIMCGLSVFVAGLDGAIRAAPGGACRVILVAHRDTSAEQVTQAFRAGVADVLLSPFTELRLDAVLARLGLDWHAQPGAGLPECPLRCTVAERASPRRPDQKMARIDTWPRVMELLRRTARGRRGYLLAEGSEERVEVVVGGLVPWRAEASPGGVAVELRRATSSSALAPAVGPGVVWFTHVDGVYGYRAPILEAGAGRIVTAVPGSLVRYTRRLARRVELGGAQRTVLELERADGGREVVEDAIVDLSTSGMAARLSQAIAPRTGVCIHGWMRLREGGRRMRLSAVVRRSRETPNGTVLGLEFVPLESTTRIVLQRFIQMLMASGDALELVTTPAFVPQLSDGQWAGARPR